MKIACFENDDTGSLCSAAVIFLDSKEAGILIDIVEDYCKRNKKKGKAKKLLKALEKLPYSPYINKKSFDLRTR